IIKFHNHFLHLPTTISLDLWSSSLVTETYFLQLLLFSILSNYLLPSLPPPSMWGRSAIQKTSPLFPV
ncbi:MAG: hypothetical protein ACK55Z_25040, partial [bacterium]